MLSRSALDLVQTEFWFVLKGIPPAEQVKVFSPWTTLGGFRWRLCAFPFGNRTKHDISRYLECGGLLVALEKAAAVAAGEKAPISTTMRVDETELAALDESVALVGHTASTEPVAETETMLLK